MISFKGFCAYSSNVRIAYFLKPIQKLEIFLSQKGFENDAALFFFVLNVSEQ